MMHNDIRRKLFMLVPDRPCYFLLEAGTNKYTYSSGSWDCNFRFAFLYSEGSILNLALKDLVK
jgi:hypothetical protein